jgi:BirA family transcriptional regulator, biotin operon repressor / biotin---[acetyl-CoA-carboxylase] ligase
LKLCSGKKTNIYRAQNLGSLFGISRAAVWKHINLLRKDGYEITARPRYGYRLNSLPDRLDYKRFDLKMIHYYKSVDSTNLTIHQLAAEGAPAFSTVVAEEQQQGRGRRGRNWFSPPESGLWFSFLLRPESLRPEDASAITLGHCSSIGRFIKRSLQTAR